MMESAAAAAPGLPEVWAEQAGRGTAGSLRSTGDGSRPPALCIDRHGPADLAGRKEKPRGFASAYAVCLALGGRRVNLSQRV